MTEKLSKDIFYYIFLLVLVFAYWNSPNNFFWRDEWTFLQDIKNQDFSFFAPHGGHILPIFKLFYFTELNIFGTVSILYLYANLILQFLTYAVVFYLLKEKGQLNRTLAVIITGILAVHPINFNTVLWPFQSCQLLELLFQILSVTFFIFFLESNNKKDLILSVIFLIIQNYCFGNGILMPIALISGSFFITDKKLKRLSILLFASSFLFFLSVQLALTGNSVVFSFGNFVKTFFYYHSVNLARFLFIKNPVILSQYITFLIIIPLIILVIKFKDICRSSKLIIYLSWYMSVSVLIPFARNSIYQTDFTAYYSFVAFLPFSLFLIELFKPQLIKMFDNKKLILLFILVSVSLVYFLVDRRMTATFSVRNFRNELNLNQSISQGTDYIAYDDPYFPDPAKLAPGEENVIRIPDPKGTFLFWKQRNKFNFLLPTLNTENKPTE